AKAPWGWSGCAQPASVHADADESDSRELRYLLGEPRVGKVLDLREWKGLRRQREAQDRRIGRIDLAVDRGIRKISRQEIRSSVDCRLNFLLGHVDAEIERELWRDDRGSTG